MAAEIAGDRWTPCGPETGAVVAIRNAPGIVNHCGVVVAPGRFLQILKGVGVHLASLDSPRYRRRIAGYYTCRPGIPGGALHKP
jgi:cell wall-associated NlpC family hydrolase